MKRIFTCGVLAALFSFSAVAQGVQRIGAPRPITRPR